MVFVAEPAKILHPLPAQPLVGDMVQLEKVAAVTLEALVLGPGVEFVSHALPPRRRKVLGLSRESVTLQPLAHRLVV